MPSFGFNIIRLAATVVLLAGAALAKADDGAIGGINAMSAEYGTGTHLRQLRIGVQGKLPYRWMEKDGKHLSSYWDANLAYWRGNAYNEHLGQRQNLVSVGFTPTVRYENVEGRGWYAEGGIGVHLLSELYTNAGKRLSTAFQFGDHIGGGYVFDNGWDMAVKLQHFSNGGIKKPNNGVNLLVIRLARPF